MKKKIVIIANWKMNLSLKESSSLINSLKKSKFINNKLLKVVICPQFILIPDISKKIKNQNIYIGAQDCHYKNFGSFTGDVSPKTLKDFFCEYVIIGHSERRNSYREKNTLIKKKIINLNLNKLIPILCIGETIKERKSKIFKDVLKKQINECVPDNQKKIIIAYEPLWSIGTGVIPKIAEIEEVSNLIKDHISKRFSNLDFKILYGGSVNQNNINEIINITNIDGSLVGGASLDSIVFLELLRNVNFN